MMIADTQDTVTEIACNLDFATASARVASAIETAGLTIFARIDHAEGARAAGFHMPQTLVLIYGNARGGTPVMLAAPQIALDLPLRVLIREIAGGTCVAFHPMAKLLEQAGVPADMVHRLDPAQRLLAEALAS